MDKEAAVVFGTLEHAISLFDKDWASLRGMSKVAFAPTAPPQGPALAPPQGPPPGGAPNAMPPGGAPPAGGPPPQGGGAPPVDPNTGMPIDPNTGMPIDPNTGMPIDPNTGQPMDPNAAAGGPPPGGDPNAAGGPPPGGGAIPPELEGTLSQLAEGTKAVGQAVTDQQATIDQQGQRLLKMEEEVDRLHKELKRPAAFEGPQEQHEKSHPAAPLPLPGDDALMALAQSQAKQQVAAQGGGQPAA